MRKSVKLLVLVLAMAMVLSLLAACGTQGPTAEEPAAEEPAAGQAAAEEVVEEPAEMITVGISLFYRRDEYYKDLDAGFVYEAEKLGYKLIIQDADTDPAKQTQQLEDFITEGVDFIALAAADPDGLAPAIEDAVAAGIPVLTFDGPANTDAVLTHVGFDPYKDGYSLGVWTKEYIENELGGVAKIAVLDFPQSAVICVQRTNGFIDAVTELEGVEIVAQQDGKAARTESMTAAETILTANSEVDIFFGINYDTGAGAKAAIDAAGSSAVVVTSGTWAIEAFEELASNDSIFVACSGMSPAVQAADTLKAIEKYLAGEELPKEFLSETTVYNASNIGTLDYSAIVARRGE